MNDDAELPKLWKCPDGDAGGGDTGGWVRELRRRLVRPGRVECGREDTDGADDSARRAFCRTHAAHGSAGGEEVPGLPCGAVCVRVSPLAGHPVRWLLTVRGLVGGRWQTDRHPSPPAERDGA